MKHVDVEMLGALISRDMHFHWAQSKIYFGRMLGVLCEFQLLVIREDLLVSGIPNINVCSISLLRIRNLGIFSIFLGWSRGVVLCLPKRAAVVFVPSSVVQ